MGRGMGYALAAVALWSTVASAFKLTLRHLAPETLLLVASSVSLGFFALLLRRSGRMGAAWRRFRGDPIRFLILGAINPFAYYLTLFHAYDRLPAQEAQAINYSWGILLALASPLFLDRPLRRRDLVAGVLCYAGVLVVATRGDLLSLRFTDAAGVAYALASTVLWALYWILSARYEGEIVGLFFLNFLVGTVLLTGYVALTGPYGAIDGPGIFGALYIGLFEMGVTFWLWLRALRLSPSTARVAYLIYLSPIVSLGLIHLLVGEPIYPSTLWGLGLILGGLWIQRSERP
ncbi:DMT family transporter [Nitratifractor sp.]